MADARASRRELEEVGLLADERISLSDLLSAGLLDIGSAELGVKVFAGEL